MSTFQIDFGTEAEREALQSAPENAPKIVGIDLGTTNSLVAVMDLTGPRILSGIVPSIVSVTKTGAIIWDFDTVQDFPSVNGVKARGGSINSMAPTVAGGMLYITSGYSGAAMPGNALLAFSAGGK